MTALVNLRGRLDALERRLRPQDAWTVTATFPDGHTATMSAQEYFEAVKKNPTGVFAIEKRPTGNLRELRFWLESERFRALYYYENNIDDGLEYPDENEILKGEQDNDK